MTDTVPQAPASNKSETEFEAGVRNEIQVLRGYFTRQLQRYRWSRAIVIISAALVPILAAAPVIPRWVLAALGAIAAATEAIAQLFQLRRSGLEAMRTSNALERQLTRYMASIDPYGRDVPDAFDRFAIKVEEIREAADKAFYDTWQDATGNAKAVEAVRLSSEQRPKS